MYQSVRLQRHARRRPCLRWCAVARRGSGARQSLTLACRFAPTGGCRLEPTAERCSPLERATRRELHGVPQGCPGPAVAHGRPRSTEATMLRRAKVFGLGLLVVGLAACEADFPDS